jgi:hypothetical protein
MAHPGSATTPTATPDVPAALARLAELVAAGKFRAARRAAASLIDQADPHTLALIARCAEALQADRDTATAALDELWLDADGTDAAIITACLPGAGYTPDLPTLEPEPIWKSRVRWVAPSRVQVRRGAATGIPAPRPDPSRTATYLAEPETFGTDDRGRSEEPSGYELDYDRAALHPTRGTPCLHYASPVSDSGLSDLQGRQRPVGYELDYDLAAVAPARELCVSCWIERSSADRRRPGGDDGLCEHCRETGRAGVPVLARGRSRAEAIEARCAFIMATTGRGARKALQGEWRRARRPGDRGVIAAWAKANLVP